MKYKTYRICLLSLVILAVVGGIFYYRNMEENQAQTVDGTFVEAFPKLSEEYLSAAKEFPHEEDISLTGTGEEEELTEAVMDAFCRNVAGWKTNADGGTYGIR